MKNGYALATAAGLQAISERLARADEPGRDALRQLLRIGIQWDTQVTLEGASHTVSQAYCSALPVGYSEHSPEMWAPFASLVLEASYEATLAAAVLSSTRTGNTKVFLTTVGGGVFKNSADWIFSALARALHLFSDVELDVNVVSYSRSKERVQDLVKELGELDG